MLIAIVGSTGTGKSQLSLDVAAALAERGRAVEIVNADAMQLYRGMDIGTAKLSIDERQGVPHHLFDVLDPSEEASVARYQVEARAIIDDIVGRGAIPLLVGGSGLYVSAVLYDFSFPGTDPEVRARLEAELDAEGPGALHQRLQAADPVAAQAIGPYNGRRIVRALEVIEITGEPFGAGLGAQERPWTDHRTIVLHEERSTLVTRLDERVERMWARGLLDEVAAIANGPGSRGFGSTAARAIGYAQALAQLRGDLTEAEAIGETQALTRRYARRQVSWFRRYADAATIASGDPERVQRSVEIITAP